MGMSSEHGELALSLGAALGEADRGLSSEPHSVQKWGAPVFPVLWLQREQEGAGMPGEDGGLGACAEQSTSCEGALGSQVDCQLSQDRPTSWEPGWPPQKRKGSKAGELRKATREGRISVSYAAATTPLNPLHHPWSPAHCRI